jgi:hypothetical protein
MQLIKLTKKYWVEIITILIIAAVLFIDQAPNMTWINTDSDGIHYTYSSSYLYPSHKGSAPLYLLLGNLFLRIPAGTIFWRMALISVLSGIAACIFILLIIRLKLKDKKWVKWYAIIGALVYGSSALAISQNTIVETYPLVTALSLGIYYFCLKEKWLTSAILMGVAGAIHPTAMLVIIPMLWAYRKNLITWRRLGVMAIFVLFYLYVPLTNRPPYMWAASNETGGVLGFVKDSLETAVMLSGKLAIYDFPKRVLDAAGIIVVSFAGASLIPLFHAFKGNWRSNVLFWMMAVPAIYYLTDLAPQTYVYLQLTVAFGAIAVGIGLPLVSKNVRFITASAVVVFLLLNAWYFDIGRTLDKNLSATQYYEVELNKVPDGQILMPYYGWEWAAIFRYNKENDRNIIPVCIDTLVNPIYQEMLVEQGIKYEDNFDEDRLIRQNYLAWSIVTLNDNVWTTQVTEPKTYGCEVILAKDNLNAIIKLPTEKAGNWHFTPSNPYGIITGSIEIEEWCFITMSNHNMLLISLVILVCYLLYTLTERSFARKKVNAE